MKECRGDSVPAHALGPQAERRQVHGPERLPESGKGVSRVHQRSEEHVPAHPGEAVKIRDSHYVVSLGSGYL